MRSLRVKARQQLTPALWNRLLKAIEQRTPQRGVGARLRATPAGVTVSGRRAARGGSVLHAWQMSVQGSEDEDVLGEVRFTRGLVAGIEAQIETKPISKEDDETGLTPALFLRKDDFGPDNLCRIYAVARFNPLDFTLVRVEMVARPETPKAESWSAFKLIGFAILDGESVSCEQMCFFNQSVFISKARTSSGAAAYAFVAA